MDPVPEIPPVAGASAETPKSVCPFCGVLVAVTTAPVACPTCGLQDSADSRTATKARIGSWSVLQKRNPSAPGMNFATLRQLIQNGQVNARSVVRGPTTHQLWQFAGRVRGVSRLLGLCHHCGQAIGAQADSCPQCGALQKPPDDPDVLIDTPVSPQYALVQVRDGVMSVESASVMEKGPGQSGRRAAPGRQRPRGDMMPVGQLAAAFRTDSAQPLMSRAKARRSPRWGILAAAAVILVAGGLLTTFHFMTRTAALPPTTAPTTAPAAVNDNRYELANELMAAGLAAEEHKDFNAARYYYEQIEQLPPTIWPAEVDRRLQIVKQRRAAASQPN